MGNGFPPALLGLRFGDESADKIEYQDARKVAESKGYLRPFMRYVSKKMFETIDGVCSSVL